MNLEGGIGLMLTDLFNGAPSNPNLAFGLFDNVRVFDGLLGQPQQLANTVPEPSTLFSLLIAALLGKQFSMRRRTQ